MSVCVLERVHALWCGRPQLSPGLSLAYALPPPAHLLTVDCSTSPPIVVTNFKQVSGTPVACRCAQCKHTHNSCAHTPHRQNWLRPKVTHQSIPPQQSVVITRKQHKQPKTARESPAKRIANRNQMLVALPILFAQSP